MCNGVESFSGGIDHERFTFQASFADAEEDESPTGFGCRRRLVTIPKTIPILQVEGRAMATTAPHYLLLTETQNLEDQSANSGFWRIVLQQIDGSDYFEVSDEEPGVSGERLQLLAAVRGLEAIDRPAQVTLVTTSQYVTRGIRRDIQAWRETSWTWERFGELHEIKHCDLWKKLDRALNVHDVHCRSWKVATTTSVVKSKTIAQRPSPLGRIGRNVLDGWVNVARKLRERTTAESLASNYG